MTKEMYLKQLGKQLKNFPPDEKNDILHYYEEYIQEIENQEELMKQLPNPKELGRKLKKGIENSTECDTMEVMQECKKFVSLGACTSAKKQMLFLLIYTIVVTGIYDFSHAFFHNTNTLINQETGSVSTLFLGSWVLMVLGFVGCSILL